jgi:hypothetical protein
MRLVLACLLLCSCCCYTAFGKYSVDTRFWKTASDGIEVANVMASQICFPTSDPGESQRSFLLGANVPWNHYGWDFDRHYQWGNAYSSEFWKTTFKTISEAGGNSARVWVFCDGRASPVFDDAGEVLPLTDLFYRNMDDLLLRARQHNIQVLLVLWNFDALSNNRQCCGKYGGLHRDLFMRPDKFISSVLIPLVSRYKAHPAVYGWELMNEPEFAMEGTGKGYTAQLVPFTEMIRFMIRCTEAIHAHAPGKMVTVGAAHPDTLKYWTDDMFIKYGAGDQGLLDVLSVHVYPWSPEIETVRRWITTHGKPVLIGETPPKVGPYSTPASLIELQLTKAEGIMYWAFYSSDTVLGNWSDIYPLMSMNR